MLKFLGFYSVLFFICRYDFDQEQFVGNQTPILVIGTKVDSAQSLREKNAFRSSHIAEECGADEFNLVSQSLKSYPSVCYSYIVIYC